MSDITQLAFAQLTDADRLAVQLIRPRLPDVERMLHPTVVRIIWPTQPTIVDARAFQETAAVVAKLRGCQYRTCTATSDAPGFPVRTAVVVGLCVPGRQHHDVLTWRQRRAVP